MAKKIVFLLIVITGLLAAQRDGVTVQIPGSSGKLLWSPKEPKEGEIVTITFEVTSSVDIADKNLHIIFYPEGKAEIIGKLGYHTGIKNGETKIFTTQVKFLRPVAGIKALARVVEKIGRLDWGDLAYLSFSLHFDTLTNTFVSYKEYWARRPKPPLPPEYTYDVVADMHTGDVLPEVEAKKLRAQMDSLKQLDSTLTDEEALEMLHDILEPMVVRYGIHKKEESVPILIKARKLMREQNLSKWDAVDKVVKEEKQKGRINFFRPGRSSDTGNNVGADSTPRQKADVTLTGTIKYKKHLIDKDIGLDTTTVDMPLRF